MESKGAVLGDRPGEVGTAAVSFEGRGSVRASLECSADLCRKFAWMVMDVFHCVASSMVLGRRTFQAPACGRTSVRDAMVEGGLAHTLTGKYKTAKQASQEN